MAADDKSKDKSVLGKEEDKKETGAPEKYADFKLPEGFTLEPAALEAATTLFKKHNLSQEGAQDFIDFHIKSTEEAADAPFKLWSETQEAWKKEVNDDPKIGPRLAEIKTNYSRMLDAMGDPALTATFREAMDYTGAANNPAIIRMIDKISQHFTEGRPVQAGKPAPVAEPGKAQGTGPKALYPNLA